MFTLLLVIPLAIAAEVADGSQSATAAVQGTVRDRESSQPLPDVELLLTSGQAEVPVRSDAQGKYTSALAPGVLWGRFGRLPNGCACPLMAFPQPLIIEASETPTELPVIELTRGRKIEGKVVDGQGRHVAGAQVRASWHAFEAWMDAGVNGPKWVTAQSDANGEFVLPGIDDELRYKGLVREIELRLFARLANRSTDGWQTIPRATEAPITLHIGDAPAAALGGQVCDLAGEPVGGAKVTIWSKPLGVHGLSCGSPAMFDGCDDLRTDADGRFSAPRQLPVRARYRAVVAAEGFLPEASAWISPGDEAHVAVDDVRLRRLRTLTGRVIDLDRNPVSGAQVFQSGDGRRTEALTDADGRFELPEVAEGRACLFVEKQGYRFDGFFTEQEDAKEVTLAPPGTRPGATESLKGLLANVLPRDQELALARRVLQPFVERAFASGDEEAQWSAMFALCEIDPAQALERLDRDDIAAVFKEHRYHFCRQAAKSLFHDSPEESRALAESIHDAGRRIEALLGLAGAAGPDEARELLAATVLTVAAVPEPTLRAIWWADAAERYLDLGDARRARRLLDQALALAPSLPRAGDGGSARGRIAEPLARLDLATALELIAPLEESWVFDRRHGNVAHRIARERPANAERVLGMLHDRYQRGVYAVRVCHRMAPVDRGRAVRLAQAIDNPYQKAYALGLMAESCAATDAAQARLWLQEAFTLLSRLGLSGEERFAGPVTAAEMAAALLPAVEAVEPHLVREYLWRTLAMRPARALPPRGWRDEAGTTATVAMLVARYDRAIARTLLEPLAERAPALICDGGLLGGNIIAAAAMIDPLWAEQIVLLLSDERQGESQSEQEQARQHLARLLSYRPEVRWRQILGGYTGLWVVGTFDNNYYAEF